MASHPKDPEEGTYEKDTEEKEDAVDLNALLLPNGTLPLDVAAFSVSYSKALLEGWVRQPSPACAAASVAGACNALMGRHRSSEKAFNIDHVIDVLKTVLEERMESHKVRVETAVSAPIDPLIAALRSLLDKDGMSLGMTFPKGTKKKELFSRIRKAVEDESNTDLVFVRLREAYKAEAEAKKNGEEDEEEGEEDGEEEDEEEGGGASAKATKTVSKKPIVIPTDDTPLPTPQVAWGWKKTLQVYLNHLCGYEKLSGKRPSTAFFGNWGITSAVRLIEERHHLPIACRFLMGKMAKGAPVEVKVMSKNTEDDIARHWATLKEQFQRDDTALIYHLKNHYALIYALRDTRTRDGKTIREVLTARKGQRPTTWVDFEEVRESMLKWTGHKIMAITRTGDVPQ